MLQQEIVLQGEAAVLVVQLSQEVVEADCGQRVLDRNRVPEVAENTALLQTQPVFSAECLVLSDHKSHWRR